MEFNATVQRKVNTELANMQTAVLTSVLLLSQQDANFKQTLLSALQDNEIAQTEDMEDNPSSI